MRLENIRKLIADMNHLTATEPMIAPAVLVVAAGTCEKLLAVAEVAESICSALGDPDRPTPGDAVLAGSASHRRLASTLAALKAVR